MTTMLWLLLAFQVKHFVCDFWLQPEYMWKNKGTLGHRGGIDHSLFHAFVTYGILMCFSVPAFWAYMAFIFEFFSNYFIDYAKMNINRIKGWKADTHPQFWNALGLDQMLHQLTYVIILAFVHLPV